MSTWRRISDRAERALATRWIAYGLLTALQLRVIWNIWKYADLTNGDTSFYYVDAASWEHGLHENVVYYPLYDAFWGTILAVVHDVYTATIIHRVAIVLGVALLVLALMRSLLGPVLGLLVAAWWAILPANYGVLYEVHLLGALPILLALLAVSRAPRREGLGIALAILLASAVLIRSELILAAALLAVALAIHEARELRHGRAPARASYVRAYVLPLALACLLIGGAYARSHVQGQHVWGALRAKEEASFCNDYAASYQQRHPSLFTGNPFTECRPLMRHDFGRTRPTILQALASNPRAVAGFGAWNAQLLPSGLQVSLFGASEFENNPGFRPVREDSGYPLPLSVLLVILVIGGVALAVHRGALSPRRITARTAWLLVTVAAIAAATTVVVLTTRPWAEYMYGLSVCVMAVTGLSVSVLLRRLGGARVLAPLVLATALVLIALVPSYYTPATRPIYESVQRLQIVRGRLQRPGGVLVADENGNELCNYLAYSYQRLCTPKLWPELRTLLSVHTSVAQLLRRVHASAIYADASMLADPAIAGLLASAGAHGWQQVAHGDGATGPWSILIPAAAPAHSASGAGGAGVLRES